MNNASHSTRLTADIPDESYPTELANYPVIHTQPIHWGEMDAFNHLNNVVFYRYAESAITGRTLSTLGHDQYRHRI